MTSHPSPLAIMLDSWAKPSTPAAEFSNHETDDQGFPLCRCEACREKSKIINAQTVVRMFGQITKQGHDERVEFEDRNQDYQEIGGMKS